MNEASVTEATPRYSADSAGTTRTKKKLDKSIFMEVFIMSTKYQAMREAEIARHLANAEHDDGARGRAFELACASAYSRKTRVAKQGQADVYIKFGRGTVRAEVKTNGGRIEGLRSASAPRFVIYRLRFVQKHKAGKNTEAWDEVREIDPVLIPTAVFLAALDRFHATKSTNGKNPEEAIQVSSKKFFEWLLDWPIPYSPDLRYTEDDFEGLE